MKVCGSFCPSALVLWQNAQLYAPADDIGYKPSCSGNLPKVVDYLVKQAWPLIGGRPAFLEARVLVWGQGF